jgi:hypothetical protein
MFGLLSDKLENVQRSFTKRLNGLKDFTYADRLKFLKLDSLEVRRLRADLTLYYKIFKGLIDLQLSDFYMLLIIVLHEAILIRSIKNVLLTTLTGPFSQTEWLTFGTPCLIILQVAHHWDSLN